MATTSQDTADTMTLGEYLRATRLAKGLEIDDIVRDTKISSSNLRAMEADDYASLPADAFTRGFYSLYARALGLDSQEMVNRFLRERGSKPMVTKTLNHSQTPRKIAKEVSSMAQPSTAAPLSNIGFILLLLLILAAGLSWYFNVNPATYISEKLRNLRQEEPAAPILQSEEFSGNTLDSQAAAMVEPEIVVITPPQPEQAAQAEQQMSEMTSQPSASPPPQPQFDRENEVAETTDTRGVTGRYQVVATFPEATSYTVVIDDIPQENLAQSGDTVTWNAETALSLTLPATSEATLLVNGIPLSLPESEEPTVTVTIPEQLLE